MVKEKIMPFLKKAANPTVLLIVYQSAALLSGLIFSYSGKSFDYSPLGVAFVCAVREKYRISASIGAALGYILYCDSLNALRFIAAILCAYVLSKLLCSFDFTATALSMGLISAFCLFSTGLSLGFAQGLGAKLFFASLTEAVFSFCACFVIRLSVLQFEIKPSLKGVSLKELILYSFCVSFMIWSFQGFSFERFSPSAAVIFYLILLLPDLCSGLGSAVFGSASCAVFCALSDGAVLPLGFVLGSAACTLAYFSSKESRLRILYLLLTSVILFFLHLPFDGAFVIEAAAASILFVATPEKVKKYVISYLSGSGEQIYDNAIKNGLYSQLHLASSAVEEISNTVTAVCEGLDSGVRSARGEIISKVTSELCASCSNYEHCWLESREKTVKVFDELIEQLQKNEPIDYQNMSANARNRCIKGVPLARAFNLAFQNYMVESLIIKEKNEMRRSIAEQFYSVGDIIDDIAKGLEENYCPEEGLSDRIRSVCFSLGIKTDRVICKKSENGRLKIEMECEEIKKEFSRTLLREKLEDICSKRLEQPVIIRGEKSDCISVCEKHTFSVEVGTSQIASNGEILCGDSFEHFYDGRGSFDVVLADGMGTGARAALDSSMARGLTETLLKKGISPSGTLRLVNSALMVKSPEESMSSLDIMQVDMFSGKTEFFKAGAAASFVRHKGRVQEIKRPAMPLGILHRVEFARSHGKISTGDIAVMVSDGIADCGVDAIRDVLRKNAFLPSEEIAEKLTETAKKISGEKHDDMTAVVCKFY